MAEPFKQTPASRVFGFGLRPQQPAPTFFGTPILADRNRLSPYLRQNAFEEQQMAAQEEALAAQQQQMAMQQQLAMRNQQIMDAEMAAEQDLAAGEQLGNIFKKNPALAFSRNAGQFASAAQMMQPSRATMTLAPQLAAKMPLRQRQHFNKLLSSPDYQNDVLAAKDKAEELMAIEDQQAELFKAGVPFEMAPSKLLSPVEFLSLVMQKGGDRGKNDPTLFMKDNYEMLGNHLKDMRENDMHVLEDGTPNPEFVEARKKYLDLQNKLFQAREGRYMPKVAPTPADAATAQKITSPAAEGGAPPAVDIDTELANVPFAAQKDYLEKKKAVEAERQAIAPVWTKAKEDLGAKIKKIVPDEPFPGTKTNQLESFAKAVLNPRDNIINHPEYGTIPAAWDILSKAGVPMNEIMTNKTVFREPGEKRRILGFLGTQRVGYQELLREWAKDFLASKNLKPTGEPTPLLERKPEKIVKKADQFLNEWEK